MFFSKRRKNSTATELTSPLVGREIAGNSEDSLLEPIYGPVMGHMPPAAP